MPARGSRRRRAPDPPPPADLAALLGAESEFLGRMDALVGLLERESRDHVARLRLIFLILTLAAIASALAVGSFALRPAVVLIRRQVDELEHRVRARTAELEEESRKRIESERRSQELQERIGRAARAGALGELAAELAHELNQPLGAIANYIEGSLVHLQPDQARDVALRGALTKALGSTHHAATIVKRVHQSILQPARRVPLDPNALVSEVVQSCAATAERRGIALETDLAPDLPYVRADGVQIQQVLANLVQNAFDAVDAAKRDPRRVRVVTGREDSGVAFRVIDSGEGIPSATLATIFDPYFSTRANGLGMGLAISRRIVTEHGGRIAAESELGRQTTIQFTLPAAGDAERTDGLHR
jgi:signal transduction histidine kinase